jgi:site-specific DNA recombinase
MNKAGIYLRVSSEEQVKGFGLEVQEEKLRDYCKLYDFEVDEKHVFREEGVSGAERNRPELNRMLACAENKEFSVVLVYKIDRLSRLLLHLLEVTNKFEQLGVGFRSVTEPIDTTNSLGRCIFQILGSFAEFERGVIRERTYGGQIKNKEQGNYVSGIPPYGYNYDKASKKLVVNKEEAKVVNRIFEWLVKDRLSLYSIQNRLNAMGIPTKLDNLGKKKKVNGKSFWMKRTLGRIVANEVYTGTFTYNKFEGSRIGGKMRPEEEWITIATPQMIDKNLFHLAQEQLKKNCKYSAKNAKYTYLLSGLLHCAQCGGKYNASYDTGRKNLPDIQKKRYTCNNTHKYIRQNVCKAPSVSEHRLANPIWDQLVSLLENPEIAFAQLEKLSEKSGERISAKERLLEVDELLEKNKSKQTKLLDAFLEIDGGLEQSAFLIKKCDLEAEELSLLDEKKRYQSMLITGDEKNTRVNALQGMYQKLKENLANITYEQKREVLKMLVNKVVITGFNLDIHCSIPYQFVFVGQSTLPHCLCHSGWGRVP